MNIQIASNKIGNPIENRSLSLTDLHYRADIDVVPIAAPSGPPHNADMAIGVDEASEPSRVRI